MTEKPEYPDRDWPSFTGWTNEEVGAFIKGLTYADTGADIQELVDLSQGRTVLDRADADTPESEPDGVVATLSRGPLTRAQWIDLMYGAADRQYRKSFKGHAMPAASQLTADVHPFLEEVFERLKAQELTLTDLNVLLSKMVIVAAASTLMAVKTVGLKDG